MILIDESLEIPKYPTLYRNHGGLSLSPTQEFSMLLTKKIQ